MKKPGKRDIEAASEMAVSIDATPSTMEHPRAAAYREDKRSKNVKLGENTRKGDHGGDK